MQLIASSNNTENNLTQIMQLTDSPIMMQLIASPYNAVNNLTQ